MSTSGGPTFEQPDFSGLEDDEDDAGFEDAEDAAGFEEDEDEDEDEGPLEEEPDAVSHEPQPVADGVDPNVLEGGAAAAVLSFVATSLVDDKEAVVIDTAESRGQLRLQLHVAPGDMGRVIGRRGRTAQALRTLVRAAAASERRDAFVDIVD